jgi:mannonate dehydratase
MGPQRSALRTRWSRRPRRDSASWPDRPRSRRSRLEHDLRPRRAARQRGRNQHEQLWARLTGFCGNSFPSRRRLESGWPPIRRFRPCLTLRGTARLVYQPHYYQKLLDIYPSKANALEFCIGSLAEMTEGDIYEVVDHYSRQQALGYVHLRNVRGKVPDYEEVFIDEGDVDMHRVLRILQHNGYDGVVIPDHTPQMTCPAPWHAGMAYTLGYIRAVLDGLERGA